MKKKLSIILGALLLTLPCAARDRDKAENDYVRHSVYAGYGLCPAFYYKNNDDINKVSGVLNFGYEYRPYRMLGVGADFGWMVNNGTHRQNVRYSGGITLPEYTPFARHSIFLSASVRGIWVELKYFSCYSAFRAGLCLQVEKGKSCMSSPSLHLIPVGLEFGNRMIGGYIELGFGTNSLASGGLRYHF